MAYNPAARAAREARFRAEHGVSSGTYYAMRRKAAAAGASPQSFDKLARTKGYATARDFTRAKRQLTKDDRAGRKPGPERRADLYPIDYDEGIDQDIDLEWYYYH